MMTTKEHNQISGCDNGGGGRTGGPPPPPFLTKTHRMVEDVCTDDVISWEVKGRSFVVWKPVEFARDLLPAHFKHNNFSSFVRQLNTYGFRKLVPDRWEFSHENFQRGEKILLHEICRRKSLPPPSNSRNYGCLGRQVPPPPSTSNSGEVQSSSTSSPSPPPPNVHLRSLSDENARLKKDNLILTEELATAKRKYEKIRSLLSKYADVSITDLGENAEEREEVEGEEKRKGSKCLKLFGVLVMNGYERDERRNKSRRCEGGGGGSGVVGGGPMKMGFAN